MGFDLTHRVIVSPDVIIKAAAAIASIVELDFQAQAADRRKREGK